jgi:hypothetical protein
VTDAKSSLGDAKSSLGGDALRSKLAQVCHRAARGRQFCARIPPHPLKAVLHLTIENFALAYAPATQRHTVQPKHHPLHNTNVDASTWSTQTASTQ